MFFTREKIEDGKPFQTGLSVNVIQDRKNPTTNKLYITQFESPEKEWEDAWKLGKVIMGKMPLDDDF